MIDYSGYEVGVSLEHFDVETFRWVVSWLTTCHEHHFAVVADHRTIHCSSLGERCVQKALNALDEHREEKKATATRRTVLKKSAWAPEPEYYDWDEVTTPYGYS